MRAFMWWIVGLAVFMTFLAAMSALTLSVMMLGMGGGWEWVCVGALAFWPAWRAFAVVSLAADATVEAWRAGRDFEVELAWQALQVAVQPGQAVTMEVDRIGGHRAPAEEPRKILARVVAAEDGGFVATGPNGAVSQGDTLEEALHNLAEAVSISE
jgi:hypothetical protein